MTGVVTRMFLSKGYLFVKADDGIDYFINALDLAPGLLWERLREGVGLEFDIVHDPTAKGNQLRGKNVKLQYHAR